MTLKNNILLTGLLGIALVDAIGSTVGWLIMNLLEANVGTEIQIYSPDKFFAMVLGVTLFGGLVGLISGGISLQLKRKVRND